MTHTYVRSTHSWTHTCTHTHKHTNLLGGEDDVNSIVEILESNWANPFNNVPSELANISTGTKATSYICQDLLGAKEIGEKAYNLHVKKLEQGVGFHEVMKKQKVKTFKDIVKSASSKTSSKEVILRTDARLFGHMLLIAQNRKLDIEEVFSYPLGSKPWSLAIQMGL